MFLSTILKQPAAKFLSIMMYKNAKHANAMLTINIANMYQDTTGNMFVVSKAAQILAQDNWVDNRRMLSPPVIFFYANSFRFPTPNIYGSDSIREHDG